MQTFWFAEARALPVLIVAGIYLLFCLCMAIWAVHVYKRGLFREQTSPTPAPARHHRLTSRLLPRSR